VFGEPAQRVCASLSSSDRSRRVGWGLGQLANGTPPTGKLLERLVITRQDRTERLNSAIPTL